MQNESNKNYWALILGGSSGMGLASAQRLAKSGMNIIVVHRDRKGAMKNIEPEFKKIQECGVKFHAFNTNALTEDGRQDVIHKMTDILEDGQVRVLLHSIALGNLKLLVPQKEQENSSLQQLAKNLSLPLEELQQKIDDTFASGTANHLVDLATPTAYNDDFIVGEEDVTQTIHNMGTSLLYWVQDIHKKQMFASDARVLGLTSEGNATAWKSYGAVSAAKCALEAVSRSIAKEFAPYGIRCNILQPGVTDTPALRLIPGNIQMKAHAQLRNPFGRLTTPQDVANVVELMSRDEASWINGAIIPVDGGERISG